MRIDLMQEGIKVSEINPGLVETEFRRCGLKVTKSGRPVYNRHKALQAEDIADLIAFIVTRPAHVNLAEVLVLPAAQASATVVHRKK